jgi:hypothetical protein
MGFARDRVPAVSGERCNECLEREQEQPLPGDGAAQCAPALNI